MSSLHDALEAMDKATALAWIKEALPWLEEMRLHVSVDPAHYDHELARLDALIARANPEEANDAEH